MAIQDELAFELDIEPETLTPIDENWVLRLMQKGVIIQLHIGYWRPYSRLSESELGISEDGSVKEYLQLGRKKLLPPEMVARLENIEKRARYALEENSFKCFWGLSLAGFRPKTYMAEKNSKRVMTARPMAIQVLSCTDMMVAPSSAPRAF